MYTAPYPGDPGLTADIAKAINGEYAAILCYQQLANQAPDARQRDRILEIRQDEIRHYYMFAQLYSALTGRQPAPQVTEPCPAAYRAGLIAAFEDEQETVDFYLDLADRIPYADWSARIRRAASDEQNHAVWFLSFLAVRA